MLVYQRVETNCGLSPSRMFDTIYTGLLPEMGIQHLHFVGDTTENPLVEPWSLSQAFLVGGFNHIEKY